MEKIIIGDIHGCFKTFMALLDKLNLDGDYSNLILCGDLIDRQNGSRRVIDFVRDNNITVVKGNHELMMTEAIEDYVEFNEPLEYSGWYNNGGDVFLAEYDEVQGFNNKALQRDYEWIKSLPVVYLTDTVDSNGRKLVVSHSHCLPLLPTYFESMDKLSDENLTEHLKIEYEHQVFNSEMKIMWDRRVPKETSTEYFNVFGHTPIDGFAFDGDGLDVVGGCLTPENVVIDIKRGYANIDSGCCYHRNRYGEYRGVLTALLFPSLDVIQQENIDE